MVPNGNVRWYFDDKRGIIWFAISEDRAAWILDTLIRSDGRSKTTLRAAPWATSYPRLDAQTQIASKFASQRSHPFSLRREMYPTARTSPVWPWSGRAMIGSHHFVHSRHRSRRPGGLSPHAGDGPVERPLFAHLARGF
jgi:hypothetical protein